MARLSELLHLPARPLIAIVGAGGKTTTMYALAHELAAQGRRVVTTTTTHIYLPRPNESDHLLIESEMPRLLSALQRSWQRYQHITVARETIDGREQTGSGHILVKLKGLWPEQPLELLQDGGADAVIVEADGARHLKIKAPADHEPVMPPHTNLVLLLLSAEALNRPLNGEIAHRPEILARLTGISPGDPLTPAVVARLLLHEQGGLKNVPDGAGAYVLVTHAGEEKQADLAELAAFLKGDQRIAGLRYSSQPGEWHAQAF